MDSLVSEDVVLGFTCQLSENEWICNHVVDVVARLSGEQTFMRGRHVRNILAVSEVVQLALLVDDAHGCFLRTNAYMLDVIGSLASCF